MDSNQKPYNHITEFTLSNDKFDPKQVTYETIEGVENAFILDNVLSADECNEIVQTIFINPTEVASTIPRQPVLWRGWSESPDDEYKKIMTLKHNPMNPQSLPPLLHAKDV
eukprot:gene5945-6885_t